VRSHLYAPENVVPLEGGGLTVRPDRRVGAILMEEGKLSAGDVKHILEFQRAEGLRFGEAAVRLGMITADDLRRAIARQYDLPHLLPDNERVSRELVVAYEPFHHCAEQMRALRAQLLLRWAQGGIQRKAVAIVSPCSGEGRSYVAANLAVAFSQLGERTLLIDADFRQPRQHEIFGAPDRIGLSTILSGRADNASVVQVPEFGALSLLPAGARPPNPQELLSRDALSRLLVDLQNSYSVILIDTPPARLCADAQTVTFRAGSALLLTRRNHTPFIDTTSVTAELANTGAALLGTVLNDF